MIAYRCLVKEDDREAPSFLFESVEPGLLASSVVSSFFTRLLYVYRLWFNNVYVDVYFGLIPVREGIVWLELSQALKLWLKKIWLQL